jgi:hypothetical protein
MSRLIEIKLDAAFVEGWAFPTGPELGYGFHQGWVARQDVIKIALAKYTPGLILAPAEETLAFLLSDDAELVDDLVATLEFSDQPVESRERSWFAAALTRLLEHRSAYTDPHLLIDMLYADFAHPRPRSGPTSSRPGPTGSRRRTRWHFISATRTCWNSTRRSCWSSPSLGRSGTVRMSSSMTVAK